MDLGLTGKVAFISGSAKGIGKQIAIALAKEGTNIVINDINQESIDEAVNEISQYGTKVIGLLGDVSDEKSVDDMFDAVIEKLGNLDILINNAGINKDKPILETSLAQWRKTFAVNLEAMLICSKAAIKLMKFERKPVIINGGSFASIVPAMGYGDYAATKAGVASFTRSLCGEVGHLGIRVCGYIPGVTNTEINKELFANESERLCAQIPLNRVAEPSEVGEVVAFLASERAGYIAGTMVEVDGGKLCVQNANRYRTN